MTAPARTSAADDVAAAPAGSTALNRLLPNRSIRLAAVGAVVVTVLLPFLWSSETFWFTVLANALIFATAAVGLSLLTGYAGQVSLGHAAFLATGGYVAAYFGSELGWPMPYWMLLAAVVGGLVGAVVGPFALRFKGNYLVVVTLAVIFVSVHVFQNWDGFTGGNSGRSAGSLRLDVVTVGDTAVLDFKNLSVFGHELNQQQGLFWLSAIVLAGVLVVARNIVRTRPGRALQAIRDRDVAAEVIGVHTARYKIAVFALSSAIASLAGGLYAASVRFLSPGDPASQLFLSIRFVAIIIIGGLGTLYGAVVGALILGSLPEILKEYADKLAFDIPIWGKPLVKETATSDGLFSTAVLSEIVFGLLLVGFLVLQPRGVAGMIDWARTRLGRILGARGGETDVQD
ncbi:MAG: branched-chain amino acid ABC transporter permease [Acidimicrobiales bacterium]|nr:branched-chain amino acid ABC transporter permease [Acidimicrobiales bacterium]